MSRAMRHRDECTDRDVVQWQGRDELMLKCRTCGAICPAPIETADPADDPEQTYAPPPNVSERRHWLTCVRCGHDLWPATSRPRVPLCEPCKLTGRRP